MAASMEENISKVLGFLVDHPRENAVSGNDIAEHTQLNPGEINDAVTILVENRLAEWLRYKGTHPYVFGPVWVTPRGRYAFEKAQDEASLSPADSRLMPAGSPFGFEKADWETVSERKSDTAHLYVVLGYQFESGHYDSNLLRRNVRAMFFEAVKKYNELPDSETIELKFQLLAAGYGRHLFNEIARDVISADVAVFDTSDLNPNVMIEMGVALTWGVPVLPIKARGCPKPPSDISGQTWADYQESAQNFNQDHSRKLFQLVKRAARKKG